MCGACRRAVFGQNRVGVELPQLIECMIEFGMAPELFTDEMITEQFEQESVLLGKQCQTRNLVQKVTYDQLSNCMRLTQNAGYDWSKLSAFQVFCEM